MSRIAKEKRYWDKASKDPNVDEKYISDVEMKGFENTLKNSKGKVLEIGCGVGRLMKNGFYGIDISEGMLKIARKRKPKCHFKLSDGRSIPYKDETFDYVYCVLVFQHIPLNAVQFYIDEAYRVLKKGGTFQFQIIEGDENEPFSKHHNLNDLTVSKWNKVVTETGFYHSQWTWVKLTK